MSLAGLLVALLMTALALSIVVYPLLRRETPPDQHSSPRDLETSYRRVLINIRDLDEDFATGKLNARSYDDERESLVQRGIDLLRQLDEQARKGDA